MASTPVGSQPPVPAYPDRLQQVSIPIDEEEGLALPLAVVNSLQVLVALGVLPGVLHLLGLDAAEQQRVLVVVLFPQRLVHGDHRLAHPAPLSVHLDDCSRAGETGVHVGVMALRRSPLSGTLQHMMSHI